MKHSTSPRWSRESLHTRVLNMGFQLFPGRCLLCHRPSGRKLDLCRPCEAALPTLGNACSCCAQPLIHAGVCGYCQRLPPSFVAVFAPFRYQFPTDGMIQSFKYGGKLKQGRVLSALLARRLRDAGLTHSGSTPAGANNTELIPPDVLLPVPLHWRRQLNRGFNQAELIARELSRSSHIPINTRIISRTRNTSAQEGLQRKERQRNLKQAFAMRGEVKNLSVAVIDDVVTTASTAEAIANCLMRAGARQVQIWAIARTALEK